MIHTIRQNSIIMHQSVASLRKKFLDLYGYAFLSLQIQKAFLSIDIVIIYVVQTSLTCHPGLQRIGRPIFFRLCAVLCSRCITVWFRSAPLLFLRGPACCLCCLLFPDCSAVLLLGILALCAGCVRPSHPSRHALVSAGPAGSGRLSRGCQRLCQLCSPRAILLSNMDCRTVVAGHQSADAHRRCRERDATAKHRVSCS